jgi:glutamine amidotransferase
VAGLGVLSGCCERLSGRAEARRNVERAEAAASAGTSARLKVPHVGWNALHRQGDSILLNGVDDRSYAYFTHSYAAPITAATVATTDYGETFASVVERGVVFGVQFHPEKSGEVGLTILTNFLRLANTRRA